VAEELRRLLPKMEGLRAVSSIPFGLAAIDRHLPQGGLSCGALHEVVPEAGATPAAFGFLVALLARIASHDGAKTNALVSMDARPPSHGGRYQTASRTRPLLLVLPAYGLRDYGRPHGHGLNAFGLPPHQLILAETAHRRDTLWAMEEALHARAVTAVAGVIDQLDLKTSQRLQLAATDCGLPLFLLRPPELLEATAAATRWRVGAAPAARDRFGLVTHARWRLSLERCRNGRTGDWMVEYDHVAHRFSLAAALADPAVSRRASETGKHEPSLRRAG
jgi:protein ImuA